MGTTVRLLLALLYLGLPSCGGDDSDDSSTDTTTGTTTAATGTPTTTETEPTVPQPGTLEMDFDSINATNLRLTTAGLNYIAAKAVLTVTSLAVVAQLAIPAAAIRAALSETAVYQGNLTWHWTYEFSHSGTTYTATLIGVKTGAASANWTLNMTKDPADSNGCCTEFSWVTGSTSSGTAGQWKIFDHELPDESSQWRQVDWTFTSDTAKSLTLTASKIKADNNNGWVAGGFVGYVVADGTVTVTIDQDAADDEENVITWNTSTQAGSFTNDAGVEKCWDTDLANTTCPES